MNNTILNSDTLKEMLDVSRNALHTIIRTKQTRQKMSNNTQSLTTEQLDASTLKLMSLHQIIEVHQAPYFRIMKVVDGWLYNFYDVDADNYKAEWQFVPQLNTSHK